MEARVTCIRIAPVKALGLVELDEATLGRTGVRGNRRFWLVDADRRLVNNKRIGPLVRIRPEWDERTRVLALDLPDGSRVDGVVELGEPVPITMYRRPLPSRRVLGPWEEAISRVAGEPLTLLWAEEHAVDRDRGTVSLVSRASLARLAERAGAEGPLDGRRFRMLFEVDGVEAHGEDGWLGTRVQVGDATVAVTGDVGRCVVTSHDPDTGVTDLDTLRALAAYRPEGHTERLPFGVYGSVLVPGRVRVGDPVAPLRGALLAGA